MINKHQELTIQSLTVQNVITTLSTTQQDSYREVRQNSCSTHTTSTTQHHTSYSPLLTLLCPHIQQCTQTQWSWLSSKLDYSVLSLPTLLTLIMMQTHYLAWTWFITITILLDWDYGKGHFTLKIFNNSRLPYVRFNNSIVLGLVDIF